MQTTRSLQAAQGASKAVKEENGLLEILNLRHIGRHVGFENLALDDGPAALSIEEKIIVFTSQSILLSGILSDGGNHNYYNP